jgi:hypothetical protein
VHSFKSLVVEDEAKRFWPPGGTYKPRPRDILIVETDQWTAINAAGTTVAEMRALTEARMITPNGEARVRVVRRDALPAVARVWLRFHAGKLRLYKTNYDSSG